MTTAAAKITPASRLDAARAVPYHDLADDLTPEQILDTLDTRRSERTARVPADDNGRGQAAPVLEPFPTFCVLEGEAPEPPGMLVGDLLVDADVNVWAGTGGAAKTVTALAVAIGVALGRPVFGTLPVHRIGPVLIVAPEDGCAEVRMMLDALVAGMEWGGRAHHAP